MKKLFSVVLLLSIFMAGTESVYASGKVSVENGKVRVTVDLDTGLYQAEDQATGMVLFRNATLRLGRWSLSDSRVVKKRTVVRQRVNDELGKGETLRVVGELHAKKRPFAGRVELELTITLYENRTAIILGAGIKNGLSATRNGQVRGIIVKGFTPFANAELWPADKQRDEAMTLDGHGAYGFEQKRTNDTGVSGHVKHGHGGNAVVKGFLNRASENNLLLTYRAGKARRTFVAGGLTYFDFLKRASVKATDKGKVFADAEAYDPVGRVVKMGGAYLSRDRIYIDLMTSNPFSALEIYAGAAAKAQKAKPNFYNFPTLCMWYVMYSGGGGRCNTVTSVRQMELVSKTDFLKYSPVAIRLVPDTYLGNTAQGWWDDEHWRKYNWYQKPYDTSKKFCRAIRDLGGLPFTYVQTGMPSDDFAKAHRDWMLNNSIKYLDVARDHEKPYVRFDYSDPKFQAHMRKVWKDLGDAGLNGVMFDYAATGFAGEGGLDDPAMTATAAYRKIFELTRQGLGPKAHIHERNLGEVSTATSLPHERLPYTDATLGLVDSQRVESDSCTFTAAQVSRAALRWYKTRVFYMYDMDSKSMLLRKQGGKVEKVPDPVTRRRSILTMMYVTSGRVLLADSFADCKKEVLHELSRIYPMHEERRTACPVDMFLPSAAACPRVYRYAVTPNWYQVTLFNPKLDHNAVVSAPLSGDAVTDGALGLDNDSEYYLYDFWNDVFTGKFKGAGTLKQELRGGEARMLSVHRVQAVPQFISTSRHVMQGYVDLVTKPKWTGRDKSLSGLSKVIEQDPYELVFACNGRTPKDAKVSSGKASLGWKDKGKGIAVLTLKTKKTADIQWTVTFE
jgi:hypothetical protein